MCALLTSSALNERAHAAQAFPIRPIRLVVPYPPGGGSDTMGRLVAQKLSESLKYQTIVDNRSGAGGRVGTEYVARSAPDGHTLLLTGSGSIVLAPALYRKLSYDVQKDLVPITMIASSAFLLVVHPAVPAHSVKALIAMARARPGALNYASSGLGAPGHLSAELFQSMAKVKMAHVSYKGTSPALMSVLSGETDLIFSNIVPAVPLVKSNRLRAIAVTSLRRSSLFPNVPTIAESGLPGYEMVTHYGVLAPAATPREVVRTVNGALVTGLQNDDTRKLLANDGSELHTSTPEEFGRVIRDETGKWTQLIRRAGIEAE